MKGKILNRKFANTRNLYLATKRNMMDEPSTGKWEPFNAVALSYKRSVAKFQVTFIYYFLY